MSTAAEIQNVNLCRAREKIAALRGPPWSIERTQTADALDAIVTLIAPYSQRPENRDADALIAGSHSPIFEDVAVTLMGACAGWVQDDNTKAA